MKILYLTRGDQLDYQDDCLAIGLKELFGGDVVDCNKRAHIYKSFDERCVAGLYGRGMSVTRIVEDVAVDRDDITQKIRSRYFDLVVYGSVARYLGYLDLVLESYPKSRIFVVDGEDHIGIYSEIYKLGVVYFKRELVGSVERIFPISFAIPGCKMDFSRGKSRDFAICDPRERASYIYRTEADYYAGYKEARLGVTTKKAGWDCMRHYEILANGCLPFFIGIEDCPEQTMVDFDKKTCAQIIHDYYAQVPVASIYERYSGPMFEHAGAHHTTTALAEYMMSIYRRLNA